MSNMVDMDLMRRLTLKDQKSKVERCLKLSEEVGELAAAILSEVNAPGCEYKTLDRTDVLQEAADVLIMIHSIIVHYDFTEEEVKAKFLEKCAKWERVIEVNKV